MEELLLSDFDYHLPKERIAQDPLEKRSDSKLLVLNKSTGSIFHDNFYNIGKYLKKGDTLVLNNTKVIPARIYGKKATGGNVEVLLLKRVSGDLWEALTRPGKKTRIGEEIIFGEGILRAKVESILEEGVRVIRFFYEGIFEEILDTLGEMPLPPYITNELKDRERYQTVYAKYEGSAAAPTAGLHFTKELLEEIRSQGIQVAEVTLHVGLGTFRPVKEENVLNHKMHQEYYEISKEAARIINNTRVNGGRVIAVGTTSVRTMESGAEKEGLKETFGNTDIFIYPGYKFKITDGIITNFHLPKSTLLMLVSAFAGRENVLAAYKEAVEQDYRFFSFGDAMLLI